MIVLIVLCHTIFMIVLIVLMICTPYPILCGW